MIWNDAEYIFRLSPVMRRAACPADSPRRMGWQTGDCAKEGVADTASARIGSAWQTMRISRNPHLSRSDTQSFYTSRVPALSSSAVRLFCGLLREQVWIVRGQCHILAASSRIEVG